MHSMKTRRRRTAELKIEPHIISRPFDDCRAFRRQRLEPSPDSALNPRCADCSRPRQDLSATRWNSTFIRTLCAGLIAAERLTREEGDSLLTLIAHCEIKYAGYEEGFISLGFCCRLEFIYKGLIFQNHIDSSKFIRMRKMFLKQRSFDKNR